VVYHVRMKRQKLTILGLVAVGVVAGVIAVLWAAHPDKTTENAVKSVPAGSLLIKEWTVTIPFAPSITDAYYTYDATNSEAYISTKQLDTLLSHIHGCTTGLHGLYYKKTADIAPLLAEQHHPEALCAVPANDETAQIGAIQAEIRTAAQAAARQ